MKVLDKCLRGRYKLLLFKSYLKIKPKKLLFRVWNVYSRKYGEDTRSAFKLWKCRHEAAEGGNFQIAKDSMVFTIIRLWTKNIHFRIKRGFYAFMKDNKHRKLMLIRALITS